MNCRHNFQKKIINSSHSLCHTHTWRLSQHKKREPLKNQRRAITTAQYLLTRCWKRVPAERVPSVRKERNEKKKKKTCKLSYYLIRCVFVVSTRQRYRYTAPYTTQLIVWDHWATHAVWPLTVVSATRHWKIIALQITNLPIRKMWTRRRRGRIGAGTARPTFICTHQRIICCATHPENYHQAEHGRRESQFSANFLLVRVWHLSSNRNPVVYLYVPALICFSGMVNEVVNNTSRYQRCRTEGRRKEGREWGWYITHHILRIPHHANSAQQTPSEQQNVVNWSSRGSFCI